MSACHGISEGVMMVLQVEATVSRHCMKLMIF